MVKSRRASNLYRVESSFRLVAILDKREGYRETLKSLQHDNSCLVSVRYQQRSFVLVTHHFNSANLEHLEVLRKGRANHVEPTSNARLGIRARNAR